MGITGTKREEVIRNEDVQDENCYEGLILWQIDYNESNK
jgi:hypothetical protein